MEGKQVGPCELSYRRQMTGELGFTRQVENKFWHVFAEQAGARFGPTREAENLCPKWALSNITVISLNSC